MTAETDRQLLARVLRFARTEGIWRRDGDTWSAGGATEVIWDAEHQMLSLVRVAPFTDRRLGADIEVRSIREALDVLTALNVLPYFFAPSWQAGVESGTAVTERNLHEHYNRHHASVVRELDDMVVNLALFVDRLHEDKPGTGCHPTPDEDCADGCEACAALADLYDEHVARVRAERAVSS